MRYDVIIVGAGIAGCGLAYNLKRLGYKGSVLVIDKEGIGNNSDCGYRNTFKEVIEEYSLPYYHKYKGMKVGANDTVFLTINEPFYFVNYKEICKKLFDKSDAEFKKEKAIDVEGDILITESGKYTFKFIIDCSGSNFFLRNLFGFLKPFLYYIGKTKIIRPKTKLSKDYFFCSTNTEGYVEDLYPLGDRIIQGNWQITNRVDFNLIKVPEENFLNKYVGDYKIVKESYAVDPISPVLPLVHGNYAFLGDSFGNASSVGEGIRPILETSKILAGAIINENLMGYGEIWKERNLETYTKCLMSKYETKTEPRLVAYLNRSPSKEELFSIFKDYPDLFLKALRNECAKFPKEALRKCPKKFLIRRALYYSYLKLKYAMM